MDGNLSAQIVKDLIKKYENEKTILENEFIEMERNIYRIQGALAILNELLGEHVIEPEDEEFVKINDINKL